MSKPSSACLGVAAIVIKERFVKRDFTKIRNPSDKLDVVLLSHGIDLRLKFIYKSADMKAIAESNLQNIPFDPMYIN